MPSRHSKFSSAVHRCGWSKSRISRFTTWEWAPLPNAQKANCPPGSVWTDAEMRKSLVAGRIWTPDIAQPTASRCTDCTTRRLNQSTNCNQDTGASYPILSIQLFKSHTVTQHHVGWETDNVSSKSHMCHQENSRFKSTKPQAALQYHFGMYKIKRKKRQMTIITTFQKRKAGGGSDFNGCNYTQNSSAIPLNYS